MILRLVFTALITLFAALFVGGCGNKGELYRIPSEISEKDLEVLEGALEDIDVQMLDPRETEIDDLNDLSQEELDRLKAKKPSR